MDTSTIKALIEAMAASDLSELEFREDGWTLRLSRRGGALPPLAAASPTGAMPSEPTSAVADNELLSPLAGIVHLSPSPGEPPFVAVGQVVEAGQPVCLIEAMKMFNTVTAEQHGTVTSVLVDTGAEVEAGQPLLRIG